MNSAFAALIAWIASVAAALSYLAINDWFGANDLYGMGIWSLPLACLVGFGVRLSGARLDRWPPAIAYPMAVLVGATLGFLTFVFAALLLGGWIGAFSFPVFFCWIFGGVIGFVSAVWAGRRRTWPAAALLVLVAAVALARANAYAQTPAPRLLIYAKANATSEEVQQIWSGVLGQPHPSGHGHDLIDGVRGASASGSEDGHDLLMVYLEKRISRERRDSITARIKRSPLVARVEPVAPSDSRGVRVSVEY